MSAKDVFHNAVRLVLGKENWQITHDPWQEDSRILRCTEFCMATPRKLSKIK